MPLFLASALLTLGAAAFFADRLDHIGPRLGLPEAAVGLITAFAADTPEISSAVVALVSGHRKASLGVVLGSNVFNLAAMIGLSALVAGSVTIESTPLAQEGFLALLGLLAAAGLVSSLLPAWLAFVLFATVVGAYFVAMARRDHTQRHRPEADALHRRAALAQLALVVVVVAGIVAGSIGMVHSALVLGDHWHVSQTVMGVLVLAALTSLPNAFTAVRLGLARRGEALVTETLASNTINLLGGLLVPALFVGVSRGTGSGDLDLGWLAVMTVIALGGLSAGRGLGRTAGAVLVGLYLAFAVVQVAVN